MSEEQTLAEALEAEFEKQTSEGTEVAVEAVEEEITEEVVEAAPDEVVEEATEELPEEAVEVAPPEHWSDEDKQAFMHMDDSGREWALRLEANAHKGIEEKSNELKKFRDAFEPYKHLVPPGVSEEQVIQQLLNAQATLQRNPVEGIKWLMQSYGVDEKQFAPTEQPTDDDVYVDPEVKALRERIEALTNQSEQDRQLAEQTRQNAMLAEIQNFKEAADDDGNTIHPHFDAVYGVMAGLLQSGRASDMEDAYQKAVWSVPEYRESEVEQKAKDFAEKQLAEKKEAAKKATKASKTVTGKSSAKTAPTERTVADSLSENYEKSIRGEL